MSGQGWASSLGGRMMTTRNWQWVAALGMLLLLAGCGSGGGTQAASTSAAPSTNPTVSPSPESASPLEGTWRAGPISQVFAEATLREHGLEEWIDEFQPVTPIAADTVLTLDIRDGEWDLYGQSSGHPRAEIDYDADYAVDGNEVIVTHADGSRTFQWSVDDDTLTLVLLTTDIPPTGNVPDEVFQRALYMTSDFTREG